MQNDGIDWKSSKIQYFLPAGLQSKRFLRISQMISLPIYGANGHSEYIRIQFSQLGNVIGIFALGTFGGRVVEFVNVFGERSEIRDNELMS